MSPSGSKSRKPWGLVLMGGGARGLAHIGVLQALDKAGLAPGVIAGTSMGAIVGAFYAAGMTPQEIAKLTAEIPYSRLIDRRLLSRRPLTLQGLFKRLMLGTTTDRLLRGLGVDRADRTEAILASIVGNLRIEDLSIPFACNAVDIVNGRTVVFTRGLLRKALRATMSYPLVFDPVRKEGQLLVDGGMLNNVPTDLARRLGAAKLIAPDIHKPLRRASVSSIRSVFHLMSRISDVVGIRATESQLERADLVYRVELDFGTFDFSRSRQIISRGRKATEKNLPAIRKLLGA
jgi:NTE family protein